MSSAPRRSAPSRTSISSSRRGGPSPSATPTSSRSASAAIHRYDSHVHDCFDWVDRATPLEVLPDPSRLSVGTAWLEPRISLTEPAVPDERLRDEWARRFPWATDHVDLTDPRPLLHGFYDVEEDEGGKFVWTAEEAVVAIRLRPGGMLVLELAAENPDGEDVGIEISSAGRSLAAFKITPGKGFTPRSLDLPPDLDPRPVALRVSRTWQPSATQSNPDDRTLGIRLRRVRIEPRS